MKKYRFAVILLVLGTVAMVAQDRASERELDTRAQAIHDTVLKFDAHVDVLLPDTPKQYRHPDGGSFSDIDKLDRGRINGLALAIAVGPGPRTPEGIAQARGEANGKLQAIRAFVDQHAQRVGLARTADDIERLYAARKIAVLLSFLNARSIGKDIAGIDRYYAEGVRLFGFTHAGNNDFADSSRPQDQPPEHKGLSPLGKRAVGKLNALGIINDVSQLTTPGLLQVLELSKAPVIASHSGVRALVDNPRNLSDSELDAIKKNGGVVHVTAFNAYLAGPGGKASITELVDHIDYISKHIGIDHVGVGTDFNHGAGITGFTDLGEALNVTRELVRRGYSQEQIAKIWGGNFLRVFRRVEQVSQRLQRGV